MHEQDYYRIVNKPRSMEEVQEMRDARPGIERVGLVMEHCNEDSSETSYVVTLDGSAIGGLRTTMKYPLVRVYFRRLGEEAWTFRTSGFLLRLHYRFEAYDALVRPGADQEDALWV